ncbi:6689_t:CDS:2, partial [Dentiscutata heterogama]
LDEALANWVLQCQAKRIHLTEKLIYEKGKKFATQLGLNLQDRNTPNFSVGWLLLFEQCYGFKMYKIYEESRSADNEAIEKSLPKLHATIIGDADLTNIKVVTLPPRTTSKLQLIDTDIIAIFKHHYRCFLLQHAIDRDEAEESDIYKVEQLKAMQ